MNSPKLEVYKLVAERQHGGAGGERGRDDEIVVPELDAPRHCGKQNTPYLTMYKLPPSSQRPMASWQAGVGGVRSTQPYPMRCRRTGL